MRNYRFKENSNYPRGSEGYHGHDSFVKGSLGYYNFLIATTDGPEDKYIQLHETNLIPAYSLKGALIKAWKYFFPEESFVKFCNRYKKEEGINPRYDWDENDFLTYLSDYTVVDDGENSVSLFQGYAVDMDAYMGPLNYLHYIVNHSILKTSAENKKYVCTENLNIIKRNEKSLRRWRVNPAPYIEELEKAISEMDGDDEENEEPLSESRHSRNRRFSHIYR